MRLSAFAAAALVLGLQPVAAWPDGGEGGSDPVLGAEVLRAVPSTLPLPSALAPGEPVWKADGAGTAAPEGDLARGRFCVVVPDRQEVHDLVAEFTGPQRKVFEEALARSARYLPMVRAVLAEEGLPEELAYLALVESHYRCDAVSSSRAVGLWQFIETTARDYGLRVDRWVDERRDPEASTRAAARHLKDLHARFGDWNLAVAAYNAGSGGVGRALVQFGAGSFWELLGANGLRGETSRYVVKFLAAITIASDPAAYGLGGLPPEPPLAYDTVWVSDSVALASVAKRLDLPLDELRRLNPALVRDRTPPGPSAYPLRVPEGVGERLVEDLGRWPEREVTSVRHSVRRGDTLSGLARRYGVALQELAGANGLGRKSVLRPGAELLIPRSVANAEGSQTLTGQVAAPTESLVGEGARARPAASETCRHRIRKGDTLSGLARRYGISVQEIAEANRLGRNSVLRPGDELLIPGCPVQDTSVVTELKSARSTADRVPEIHVVRPGDTVWGISRHYGVSPLDLLRWNKRSAKAVLRPGERLYLAGGQGAPS